MFKNFRPSAYPLITIEETDRVVIVQQVTIIGYLMKCGQNGLIQKQRHQADGSINVTMVVGIRAVSIFLEDLLRVVVVPDILGMNM